jgi:hypothetical protein
LLGLHQRNSRLRPQDVSAHPQVPALTPNDNSAFVY